MAFLATALMTAIMPSEVMKFDSILRLCKLVFSCSISAHAWCTHTITAWDRLVQLFDITGVDRASTCKVLLSMNDVTLHSRRQQGRCCGSQRCSETPRESFPSSPQRSLSVLGWECPAAQTERHHLYLSAEDLHLLKLGGLSEEYCYFRRCFVTVSLPLS